MSKEYVIKLANVGKRKDGRGLLEYRSPVSVAYGVSSTAEGSAMVTIGKTQVIVGIKLSIEKPYPDTPDQGGIMVNVELLPLSSSQFEPGPPSIKAVELARVVDRGIREAKAIDVRELCIEKGEKAWTISIDVVTINDDGNLFDAAGLGALAALKDAKFPHYENGNLDYKNRSSKTLSLYKEPIAVTIYKIGSSFIVDPSIVEEDAADARLTVTTTADGTISALQKGGDAPLTVDEVAQMVAIGIEKGSFLRKEL